MKQSRVFLGVFVFVIALAPFACAASTCSLRGKTPPKARIFAKVGGHSDWQEYHSLSDLPDLSLDSGVSAQFLQHKKGSPSVTIIQPGEDFWLYTRYCFDEEGQLAAMSFELRTSLGWGLRREGTAGGSSFSASPAEFFDTKTGKTVSRPMGVGSVPNGIRPQVYMKLGELPFAPLLSGAPGNVHPKRPGPARRTALASNEPGLSNASF